MLNFVITTLQLFLRRLCFSVAREFKSLWRRHSLIFTHYQLVELAYLVHRRSTNLYIRRMKRLSNELKQQKKHEEERLKEGVEIFPQSEENLTKWTMILSFPFTDSLYYQHKYTVNIEIPNDYPMSPPICNFATKIFHPNIKADTGEICLNILKQDEWSISYSLYSVGISLVGLINTPNCDSPLNLDAGNLYRAGDILAYKSLIEYFYKE